MESFWKWLMRANARAIFGGAVVGLIAVSGWYAWRELAPAERMVTNPRTTSTTRPQPGIGLVAFIDRQIEGYATPLPTNPFFDETPPKRRPPREQVPRRIPRTVDIWNPFEESSSDPPVETRHVPPPRKKEVVQLTYRGMFQRPDGKSMAVIEDSKNKSTKFYNMGSSLFGITIGLLAEREAAVVDADGNEIVLPFGEAVRFEDGQHAD